MLILVCLLRANAKQIDKKSLGESPGKLLQLEICENFVHYRNLKWPRIDQVCWDIISVKIFLLQKCCFEGYYVILASDIYWPMDTQFKQSFIC